MDLLQDAAESLINIKKNNKITSERIFHPKKVRSWQ